MSDYRGLIKEIEESGFHSSNSNERLVYFLYLMMRDEVPTGVICKHITDISGCDRDIHFSNPHLEALARDYANRLREG